MSAPDNMVAKVAYVSRFGGFCRDCADEDGICPTKGLPCDSALRAKAIEHVIAALDYRAALNEGTGA